MKINRFLIIIFVAVTTLLVSCEEYEDTVVPGAAVADDFPSVRFLSTNPAVYEFDPTGIEDITVTVIRSYSSGALEVPIIVVDSLTTEGVFTIPSTVSFADGEDTVAIPVAIDPDAANAADGDPEFVIQIPEEYVNGYKAEIGELHTTIAIVVWVKYAAGDYYSALFDSSWPQDLYTVEGTNKFRFYELYTPGGNPLSFTLEGDNGDEVLFSADGYMFWDSGFTYGSYGLMTVYWDSAPYSYYDADAGLFQFEGFFYLGSSGYGWQDDIFTITSKY